ncbi:hypothetical protein [Nocardia australiensis]|uniref:PIN-like domain-containing protein n=1 Tax=Nocardia australiensis TaxID=2887191 RepID=UPI001D13D307|nr:hypothetical protein [Nocardia australiensis]
MRFFLDNNETDAILPVLKLVFHEHEFRTAAEEKLQDALDIPLFYELRSRTFDAIVTRDKNQLSRADEKAALRESGLHWIGHRDPNTEGINIITSLTAGYLSAFPHILKHLERRPEPTAFHVKAVERSPGQRVAIRPL